MKNLICVIFGHRPKFGYGNQEGEGYFRVLAFITDGMGIRHAELYCACERCGVNYQVGMIQLPMEENQRA
jgi:hypothetical protein